MSKVRVKVQHLPSVPEYRISVAELRQKYLEMGIQIPFPPSDYWYYFTDREGTAKLVSYLLFRSDLYKPDRFDCEDYALKAQVTCAELFGLNYFRYAYGNTPWGAHGFNCLWVGDGFLLFEPNAGFQGQLDSPLFEWGENGYEPTHVLL